MKHENVEIDADRLRYADGGLLPPGQPLEATSEIWRDAIREIYMEAERLEKVGYSRAEVDAAINCLDAIPGIDIIEPRSFHDGELRCAEYVFGELYGEQWAKEFMTKNEPLFWKTPIPFLAERGYIPIEQPRQGDIVAYGYFKSDEALHFGHFGIYVGENKVVSKYGRGPIVLHDISLVSKARDADSDHDGRDGHWGDYVWYFAKDVTDLAAL